ncbi:YHS domain-containing (seleno)protein [Albimonas sp. CAU 1670]|uniref:YHS domain-containing (seleno)protein n=1 Tax=Albimonas sp. CAU 1670 TaxID=3032599 RepID=UPI0023DA5DAB|nr:YHS domain-containing (seleno)protein [Albimonas sp. CAU 1670]MDF2235087.1 YHS domain-containing (seleno)protein [Albimonas sp. CAU 1670]
MTTRLPLRALVAAAALTCASATFVPAAFAADEYNVSTGVTLAGAPLGLHGVDPVSMFASEAPRIGDAVHTATHDGVDYYFASAETRDRFVEDPEAYLPQFGGFCAFGVYKGRKLDGDVRYADIVDGKLYLFVNAQIFEAYLQNREEVISVAHAAWPGIRSTPAADL